MYNPAPFARDSLTLKTVARLQIEDGSQLRGIPEARLALIERIVTAAPRRMTGVAATVRKHFLREYFRGVGEDDLAERPAELLAGMALRHLEMGRHPRAPGDAGVAVFNPEQARDGFESPYTMVMVVTDDMPFLVDSLNVAFAQAEIAVHFIAHPVLAAQRDSRGRLLHFNGRTASHAGAESWQFFEIDRQSDPARIELLHKQIETALADTRRAVEDWKPMLKRVRALVDELQNTPPSLPADEVNEARHLLEWMASGHFVFLGYKHYRLERQVQISNCGNRAYAVAEGTRYADDRGLDPVST